MPFDASTLSIWTTNLFTNLCKNVCIFIFAGVAANLFLKSRNERNQLKEKRMDSFATTWEGGHVVWQTNKMFFKSEFAWKKSWVLREGESLPFQVNQNGRYVVGSDPAKAGKKLHAIINVCIYNWLSLLLIPNKVFKKITLVTRTNCKLKIIVPTMKHTPWW